MAADSAPTGIIRSKFSVSIDKFEGISNLCSGKFTGRIKMRGSRIVFTIFDSTEAMGSGIVSALNRLIITVATILDLIDRNGSYG